MSTLPLFSYPLTITVIDDDPLFSEAITTLLVRQYPLKTFNNPVNAIEFFDTYTPLLPSLKLIQGCTELENYDVAGHLPVDLNLKVLKKLISDPMRSQGISVLIVDYNMPGMNGLDVCRKLKSLPMKKILLTGEGNNQLAIDAFNEGIIDCFIKKESPSLPEDICHHLSVLNQAYLSDNTKQLVKHLETDHLLPVSDPVFITFFNEWCRAHRIKEYYIIDQNANFMLIDEHNVTSFFITHTERTLNNFIEMHEDDQSTSSFVNLVQSREQIPFFGEGKEGWEINTSEWGAHFKAPKVLAGREQYYWITFNS